jgi:hypothetical protein
MFDSKEQLDAIAKQARQNLAMQKQEEEGTPNTGDQNYYQDMIDEQAGEQPGPQQNYGQNDYDIKNTPDTYQNNPAIKNQPTEDEYQPYPEINEFDKPVFPGGPLQSEINSWKKQFVGYDIYVTEVSDMYFVFRTLNRFEYKQIVSLQNTDPLQREDIICETCTLWPSDYKWDKMATGKAGVPSTYSQIIMEKSGFTKDFAIQIL